VNKDVRMANEIYLKRDVEKTLLKILSKKIKEKYPNIFNQLRQYGLVKKNGDLLESWSGKKGVKFIQIMLNYLLNKSLKVDGLFGPRTLLALLQFQRDNEIYKSATLEEIEKFLQDN
jgi:hypothetical protein